MSPLFLDQLDKERRQVFKKLKVFSSSFVLAGGTAIMLQIGHRLSYDFDLFCSNDKLLMNFIINKMGGLFA